MGFFKNLVKGIDDFFKDEEAEFKVKCPVCGFTEKKKDTDTLSMTGRMEFSDMMEGLSHTCVVCEKCGVVFERRFKEKAKP